MICPTCYNVSEPRRKRVNLQGDEWVTVLVCPTCGSEMEEEAVCPLCEEPRVASEPMCFNCRRQLTKSLKWAVDAVAIKGVNELIEWEAVADIAELMIERQMLLRRRGA